MSLPNAVSKYEPQPPAPVVVNPIPTEKPIEQPRRFNLPDIDRHGNWLFARMVQAYPHFNERTAFNYIRGIIQSSNNEWMMLYMTRGVALAQLLHLALTPAPVIQIHFIWMADPANKDWVQEGAEFYAEYARWASRMRLDTIVGLNNHSDIPSKLCERVFARVSSYNQLIGKVNIRSIG